MLTFQIKANGTIDPSACSTCCCESVRVAAGSTDKWALAYGAWSRPLGGQGITANVAFDIQRKTIDAVTQANFPPVPVLFLGVTPFVTPLAGTLTATDAEANTLTYAALPLYGPTNGSVVITSTGAFTYTPNPGFTGYDRFFFTVVDAFNAPVVGEAIIGVSPLVGAAVAAPTASMATPVVTVRPKNVKIDSPWQQMHFPLEVSAQAKVGDIYRLTVRAQAIDCDCNAYYRQDCFDITIGACK
jgi:hypothetical protein